MSLRKLFTSVLGPAAEPELAAKEAEPRAPEAAPEAEKAEGETGQRSEEKKPDAKAEKTTTGDIGSKLADASVLDLVFGIDATGSMGSYIHSAQQSVRTMIQTIVEAEKADVRFALVSYRDHPPQDHSFVTKTYPFTKSISKMRSNLDTLSASGGGDGPEAVADCLHAVYKLDFRPEATKICVLISDAPPHGLSHGHDGFPNGCPDGLDPIQECRNLAQLGVSLYCVGCEPAINPYRDFFMAMANITGGQYAPLSSAQGLSDLIVGGAREEIALERIQADVDAEVEAAAAAGEELDVEKVHAIMSQRKHKVAQLRRGNTAMTAPSAQSRVWAEVDCLAEVKKSFSPAPAAAMFRSKRGKGLRRSAAAAPSRSSAAMPACAAAPMDDLLCFDAPAEESYTVASEAVSMEQCRRMVTKSKARKGY